MKTLPDLKMISDNMPRLYRKCNQLIDLWVKNGYLDFGCGEYKDAVERCRLNMMMQLISVLDLKEEIYEKAEKLE